MHFRLASVSLNGSPTNGQLVVYSVPRLNGCQRYRKVFSRDGVLIDEKDACVRDQHSAPSKTRPVCAPFSRGGLPNKYFFPGLSHILLSKFCQVSDPFDIHIGGHTMQYIAITLK